MKDPRQNQHLVGTSDDIVGKSDETRRCLSTTGSRRKVRFFGDGREDASMAHITQGEGGTETVPHPAWHGAGPDGHRRQPLLHLTWFMAARDGEGGHSTRVQATCASNAWVTQASSYPCQWHRGKLTGEARTLSPHLAMFRFFFTSRNIGRSWLT